MIAKEKSTKDKWVDPDDAPELTADVAARAQIARDGKIIRKATGTLTKRGRPPVGDEPKQQVTLRLAPKVLRYFRQGGEGWQSRLNEALEQYVVRDGASGKFSKARKTSVRPKSRTTTRRNSA